MYKDNTTIKVIGIIHLSELMTNDQKCWHLVILSNSDRFPFTLFRLMHLPFTFSFTSEPYVLSLGRERISRYSLNAVPSIGVIKLAGRPHIIVSTLQVSSR